MGTRRAVFRLFLGILTILFLFPASGVVPHGQDGNSRPQGILSASSLRLDADFGKIPLQFIPNRGQVDGKVAYYVQGLDKAIYFTAEGLTFVLARRAGENGKVASGTLQASEPRTESRWVVKLDFLNSDTSVKPAGLEESGTVVSYFKGRPEEWNAGLRACSKIIYRELWPGIDLVYSGTFDRMKYEFVIRPGADPSMIRLAYRGAESVAVSPEGRLMVRTPAGGFDDDLPIAYQEVDGARREVPVAYALEDSPTRPGPAPRDSARFYGFKIGEYDPGRILVLDPSAFIYCGYIGGSGEDKIYGIAVDNLGNAYITGFTSMSNDTFPVIVGPDLTFNGTSYSNYDAYVAKINASGESLDYCGYIGGSGGDFGFAIAVDSLGNAYVTGETDSDGASFPVGVGPDSTHNGNLDAFVAKINASGESLDYCGYIGGSSSDKGRGIAVDALGNAYITGSTRSSESTFPVAVGPDLTFNNNEDAFVAKVDSSGTALVYCGYIGSSGNERGLGIAVDILGYAYVAGNTFRLVDEMGAPIPPFFPEIVGPDLTFNGYEDAFVAKVDTTGVSLVYSGYIGGLGLDFGTAVAVDGAGNAFVVGYTESDQVSFPVSVGPDLTHNGGMDAFVAKVNFFGAGLDYCGYIGGADGDFGYAVAVDSSANAYVTGLAGSDELTFPVVNGPDRNMNGGPDVFVAKVDYSGGSLAYCGYIGAGSDSGFGIAVDAWGCAYVAGNTVSQSLPVTVGPDLTHNLGGDDGFVAKVPTNPVIVTPAITSLSPSACAPQDPAFTLVVNGSDFGERAIVRWDWDGLPTTYVSETELHAEVMQGYLGSGKIVPITVRNPEGEYSNALDFSINNPVPVVDSIEPTYLTGGGPDTGIVLKGSGFVENSVLRWNGQARETGPNVEELWAIILESDLAHGGEAVVTVFNPEPAGGASNVLTIPVTSFTLGISPQSATVAAGQAATYTIQAMPQLGPYDARVAFSCSGLPRDCTASFYPAGATPGADGASTVLTLTTRARSATAPAPLAASPPMYPLPVAIGLLLLLRLRIPGRRPHSARRICAGAAVCLIVLIAGCGTEKEKPPATGTPAGTHIINVKAQSGTMTVSMDLRLVVQ